MTSAIQSSRPKLHIVSNSDERFFPGLSVAVASAVAAASGKFDYHFMILDGGLNDNSLNELDFRIKSIAKHKGISATLKSLPVDQRLLMALPERRGSRMTYAKLVLPEVLHEHDSIIYLDADVLCFAGLDNVRPPENEAQWLLAGARDFFSVIEKDCPWIAQVPADERKLPYINCGIMWMNLKGLRDMDFTARAIASRAAIGNARQGDQSVFNFICRGRSFVLPKKFNHMIAVGSSRPLCKGVLDMNIHHIGAPKPWLGPPKTSNWLAHCLWHQAYALLFGCEQTQELPEPSDLATVRRKAMLYTFLNPVRAVHYRSDLRSLRDPGGLLDKAREHWAATAKS
jgi:lipopolysaccharide biosynthesis glycosyltransferase